MKFTTIFSMLLLVFFALTEIGPSRAAIDDEEEEEARTIKLDKRLQHDTLEQAKTSLTERLLSPPVNLGASREDVRKKYGVPKEIIGFGTEYFELKEATLMVSYTSNDKGDVIVNAVEFRPKKGIAWSNWFKSSVQLPKPPAPEPKSKKNPVRLTVQVHIDNFAEKQGLHITLIGNENSASFINWNLIN